MSWNIIILYRYSRLKWLLIVMIIIFVTYINQKYNIAFAETNETNGTENANIKQEIKWWQIALIATSVIITIIVAYKTGVNDACSSINTKTEIIQQSIGNLEQDVIKLNHNFNTLENQITAVENKLNNLTTAVEKSFNIVEDRFTYCKVDLDYTKEQIKLVGSAVFPEK